MEKQILHIYWLIVLFSNLSFWILFHNGRQFRQLKPVTSVSSTVFFVQGFVLHSKSYVSCEI